MTDQLKACPFCGGVAVVRGRDKTPNENFLVDTGGYFVACESCHMTRGAAWFNDGIEQVSNHNYDTVDEAAAAWNTRAQAEDEENARDIELGRWCNEAIVKFMIEVNEVGLQEAAQSLVRRIKEKAR